MTKYLLKLMQIKIDDEGIKTEFIVENTATKQKLTLNHTEITELMYKYNIKNAVLDNNGIVHYYSTESSFMDLTGNKYGDWTVVEYLGNKYWACKCNCGRYKAVYTQSLLKGTSKSCQHHSYNFIDLTGQTIGDWHVIDWDKDTKKWNCECSCSPGIIHKIPTGSLTGGLTLSCGHDKNQFIDLTGQTFGEWTVHSYDKTTRKWNCTCSCNPNKVHQLLSVSLREGKTKSCGHATNAFKSLIDKTYGKLTVQEYIGNQKWKCKCKCGNEIITYSSCLLKGYTTSCGHCGKPAMPPEVKAVLSDRDAFLNALTKQSIIKGANLTLKEIAELFNISISHVCWLLDKYGAHDYVEYLNGQSYAELEIIDWLKQKGLTIEQRNRKILNGKELDIYIPDKHIAIEYNGSYHHSSLFKETGYHKEKTLSCLAKGITLIHIFDYEWENPNIRQKIINLLNNYLDIDNTTVYARDTEIRNVTVEEQKRFLNTYHLQGYIPCDTALGLYHNNELLQLMTFDNPRFNREYNTELLRLCSKAGYKIIGGANKLFNHYVKEHQTETILTYCDISKFTGKVYEQLGMTLDCITAPNYVYVHKPTLMTLSSIQCTKQSLLDKGWGTPDMTEEQIMISQNYLKVCDSGNSRYVYRPN